MNIVKTKLKVKVASIGAGVQSSYIALNYDADYYIFADTGDEQQETYEFIENTLIPEMKKQGKELIIVKWWEMYDCPDWVTSMLDYYLWKGGIPTRKFRSCTDRFKIRVIRKYLRSQGVKKAEMMLGITTDEYKRMRDSDVQWIENKFPLIDEGLARYEIEEWWKENYGFIPPKSGCYYCIFITPERFVKYTDDKPRDRNRVILMENQAMQNNVKLQLWDKPVEKIISGINRQQRLDQWDWDDDDRCDSGMCFT